MGAFAVSPADLNWHAICCDRGSDQVKVYSIPVAANSNHRGETQPANEGPGDDFLTHARRKNAVRIVFRLVIMGLRLARRCPIASPCTMEGADRDQVRPVFHLAALDSRHLGLSTALGWRTSEGTTGEAVE